MHACVYISMFRLWINCCNALGYRFDILMRNEAEERSKVVESRSNTIAFEYSQRCRTKESAHSENITRKYNANAYLALGMHNIFWPQEKETILYKHLSAKRSKTNKQQVICTLRTLNKFPIWTERFAFHNKFCSVVSIGLHLFSDSFPSYFFIVAIKFQRS